MSLDATPAGRSSDTYATLAEANEYFSSFYYGDTVWSGAADALKEQALRMATKIIDRLRFFEQKLCNEQKLSFPRSNVETASGTAESGSTTTLVSTGLQNKDNYPDDYWNYGCVEIIAGTNKYEKRQITDFVRSTGTVTCAAFSVAIDSTSQFRLIKEVPRQIKHAQCEIALWIIKGNIQGSRAQLQAEGVKSFSIGELSETFDGKTQDVPMPKEAENLLSGFISKIGYWGD